MGCWEEVKRLIKKLDPSITLTIEVDEVANGFPTVLATRAGVRHAAVLKTLRGAAVYAIWIAYTQREFDMKRHTIGSVKNLVRSMVGRQIRNEYAAAVKHNVVAAFGLKWGGTPGLAKVSAGGLFLQLKDNSADDSDDETADANAVIDPP